MSPQSCNYNNLYIWKVNTIIPYQVNTNFWGSPDNNYGFGSSNITDAISAHPAMNTSPVPIIKLFALFLENIVNSLNLKNKKRRQLYRRFL